MSKALQWQKLFKQRLSKICIALVFIQFTQLTFAQKTTTQTKSYFSTTDSTVVTTTSSTTTTSLSCANCQGFIASTNVRCQSSCPTPGLVFSNWRILDGIQSQMVMARNRRCELVSPSGTSVYSINYREETGTFCEGNLPPKCEEMSCQGAKGLFANSPTPLRVNKLVDRTRIFSIINESIQSCASGDPNTLSNPDIVHLQLNLSQGVAASSRLLSANSGNLSGTAHQMNLPELNLETANRSWVLKSLTGNADLSVMIGSQHGVIFELSNYFLNFNLNNPPSSQLFNFAPQNPTDPAIIAEEIWDLAIDGSQTFAATRNGIYAGDGNGGFWNYLPLDSAGRNRGLGASSKFVSFIKVDTNNVSQVRTVLAGTLRGLVSTPVSGLSAATLWKHTSTVNGLTSNTVNDALFTPNGMFVLQSRETVAGVEIGGGLVSKSTDGGETFAQVNFEGPLGNSPDAVWSGIVFDGRLFLAHTRGVSWASNYGAQEPSWSHSYSTSSTSDPGLRSDFFTFEVIHGQLLAGGRGGLYIFNPTANAGLGVFERVFRFGAGQGTNLNWPITSIVGAPNASNSNSGVYDLMVSVRRGQ